MSAVQRRPEILTETSYDTNDRLPLRVGRHIVFGAADVEHDGKEGCTNGGHDWYRNVKSELTVYIHSSMW